MEDSLKQLGSVCTFDLKGELGCMLPKDYISETLSCRSKLRVSVPSAEYVLLPVKGQVCPPKANLLGDDSLLAM